MKTSVLTISTQQDLEREIAGFLRQPAERRELRIVPMRGAVDLSHWMEWGDNGPPWFQAASTHLEDVGQPYNADASVIVAGGYDPLHPDWVRLIRDQCAWGKIPFSFLGWGEYAPLGKVSGLDPDHFFPGRDKRVSLNSGVAMDEPVSVLMKFTQRRGYQ